MLRNLLTCSYTLVVLGCGTGSGGPICNDTAVCIIDASVDTFIPACSLTGIGGTGCMADEKCAWLRNSDLTEALLACVPLGGDEVSIGEVCTESVESGLIGDNCQAGLFCFESVCTQICGLTGSECPRPLSCVSDSNLFTVNGVIVAGLCR